ncbi:hypothetical protein G6F65_022633 [Rhizopus arrhizus]|nr:hypothetical protein G6F65_022633 [Rhizopus arrhizus]
MLRLDRARLASRTMITWSKGYPEATGRDFSEVMQQLGLDDEATVARLAPAGAIYFLMDAADTACPSTRIRTPANGARSPMCCARWCVNSNCYRWRPPSTR